MELPGRHSAYHVWNVQGRRAVHRTQQGTFLRLTNGIYVLHHGCTLTTIGGAMPEPRGNSL